MTNGVNRVLDELAKLMTDTAGAAQGVRKEAESLFRSQAEKVLGRLDLVQRDDFEAVKEMAAKALDQTIALKTRVDTLENQLQKKFSSENDQ